MAKVSVIMPVYNQKAVYLRAAIESILGQMFHDLELIVIDDGSTENEISKLLELYSEMDHRMIVLKNSRNFGIVHSLNRGLSIATGEYIARMDSDDIALPERLEKQLSFLKNNRDCDLVGSWVTVIDESGGEIGSIKTPVENQDIKRIILRENPVLHPTWMFRKSLIDTAGAYDEKAVNTEDYEFLLRIANSHGIVNIPEALLKYRFNTKGLSFGKNKLQEKNALVVRFNAIREYGYPKWQAIYLLRPIFSYLFVPSFLKKTLLKISFKTS